MSFELPILRRIDKDDTESIEDAIKDGFDFIGTLHSYEMKLFPQFIKIRTGSPLEVNQAIRIGLLTLRHSRLYADPKIPFALAQQVYTKRIREAFRRSVIFVALHDSRVIGFCTLLKNEIELIAVEPHYQQWGIGSALVQECASWCQQKGHERLIVKTQGSNKQARRFYEKCGFERKKIEKDFHKYD